MFRHDSGVLITDLKYFDKSHKNRCHGAHVRILGRSGCWRNDHTFPVDKVCDV